MHVSPTEKVIIGQDGWLFLHYNKDKKRDNSYESYFGTRLFTPEELHRILENLKSVQSLLKKKNIRFAVFISPGKPSIYGDKLPPAWRRKDPDGTTRAIQLYDHIRKNSDIPIEFPRKELIAARRSIEQPLYFKTDTHWNSLGGYIGACSMMKLIDPEAARKMPDLASYELTLVPRTANDLRRMLNLPPQDEHDAWQVRHPDFRYERYLTVNDSGSYSFTGQDPNGKRAFFIRDSFLGGMAPYLACHLSYFTCYWSFSLNMSLIEMEKPDIVVVEIVERFLDRLLDFKTVSLDLRHGESQM